MSLASVSPIEPNRRKRKPRRAEVVAEWRRARLTDSLAKATTPGQIVAAGVDYLRTALAEVAKTDPAAASAVAWEIHHHAVQTAEQLTNRRSR